MERVKPSQRFMSELRFKHYDPVEHARMKADSSNQVLGDLEGYDCQKCLNRGYITVPRNDGGIIIQDCDCKMIRRCIREMEKSGLSNAFQKQTFGLFDTAEEWQKRIKQGAMAYAEKPEGWLLFCGQPGSGKSHLCTAVCKKLLEEDRRETLYKTWRELSPLKNFSMDSQEREDKIGKLKCVPVLYLDDLFKTGKAPDGSCNPTRADVDLAFDILNARYVNQLPTIISTERTPDELIEIDEALGGRILERAEKHTYAIRPDQRKDYRLRGML